LKRRNDTRLAKRNGQLYLNPIVSKKKRLL